MIARQLSLAGLALAACLASGTIGAQQQQQQPTNPKEAMAKFSEKFKAADANQDGKLTREEAQAMPEVYKNFDKIDAKKKGEVTERQVGAYWAAKAKQRNTAQNPGGLN